MATSPEFRDVSPHQIVPALADQGRYLASESTFYRILREKELMEHRASRGQRGRKDLQERMAPMEHKAYKGQMVNRACKVIQDSREIRVTPDRKANRVFRD